MAYTLATHLSLPIFNTYTNAGFPHSTSSSSEQPPEAEPPNNNPDDVEDGEITDDGEDEEEIPPEPAAQPEPNPVTAGAQPTIIPVIRRPGGSISDSDSIGASIREQGDTMGREKSDDKDRINSDEKDNKFSDGRGRHRDRKNKDVNRGNSKDNKGHRHMTEAERSILHLRKKEKMLREREKWEKPSWVKPSAEDDDFAKNIEKTLASILNKKEKEVAALSAGEDGSKDDEGQSKKGKKRKRPNKDNKRSKNKHRRTTDSPRSEIDENEMLNIRSGSPGADQRLLGPPLAGPYPPIEHHRRPETPSRSDDSYNNNSDFSSEEREERRRRVGKHQRKKKEKRRMRREQDLRQRGHREDPTKALQDAQGVCVFYLQGKCQKNDCPYSHEVSPPMKLELCKFYLMECCAKGENCSYMHSEFPCKFYHTGLPCSAGQDCKFAHGKPLSDGLKQILFKHIETAPRDILQGFPRLSRDEALNLINQTQKKLSEQYGGQTATSATATTVADTTSSLSSVSLTTQHSSPSSTVTQQQQQQNYGEQHQLDLYGGLGMYNEGGAAPSGNEKEKQDGGSKDLKTNKRNKNSRWQHDQNKSYHYGTDHDMRFSSNGDVDMRTLPTIPSANLQDSSNVASDYQNDITKDVDIRQFPKDTDIRIPNPFGRKIPPPLPMDVDNRHVIYESPKKDQCQAKNDERLEAELPRTTRDLIARINANQKDNLDDRGDFQDAQARNVQQEYEEQNINWYSDDDDDDENRLTIKVEEDDISKRDRRDSASERDGSSAPSSFLSPPAFNSQATDIVGKLGDLSKIDISVEVTKLLSSMSQNKGFPSPGASFAGGGATGAKTDESSSPKGGSSPTSSPVDPRINKQTKVDSSRPDPRLTDPRQRGRQNSTDTREKEKKEEKMSIYEQGGMDMKKAALEIENEEFRSRPDIDLRNMSLPFKGMQNYTPATEVDASINSHPPMVWKVIEVEIPRPDYTGLKLSISDAEKTGDPRLRKIFRLNIDEKDSPASPKASPKHSSGVRIDPRLRKMEEKSVDPKDSPLHGQMSYNQQVNMLQSSQFYQSLTSNQKVMLNQELARCDQSGGGGLHDPVLNTLLATLNLLPAAGPAANPTQPQMAPQLGGAAGTILANINKMNPIMNPNAMMGGNPGLLGAAPGIPNMNPNLGPPPDYSINFDPRGAPGILGNPPPQYGQFGGMEQQGFNNYNEEYYGGFDEQQGNNNMMNHQGNNNNMGGGGHFRQGGRGYNNNRDQRQRGRGGGRDGGNFRGRGNNRNFNQKRGGGREKMDRGERERRGNRGHSPQ